ncbi:MAG: sulfatase-like hydrolase/transferase [Verrucomicrobia bacterium]|nr:sulfatase-like hydrolase/transferase [Verrucomicrobiota bacterium]
MKRLLNTTLCALLGLATCLAGTANASKPNIVLILSDDLGWMDLGCYGADLIETPHLDRFAQESVRFTDAYAMPVCSPTRAVLMTGKHAARLHITIWAEGALEGGPKNRKLLQGESLPYLPHTETTIAKHLHDAGYLTALVGKWHLGDSGYYPETHGFDVNIGGTHWGAPQTFFWPYSGSGRHGPQFRFVPHLEFGKPGEYLPDRLTDEALRVIDRAGRQPFFLYFAHHSPHTPIEAKVRWPGVTPAAAVCREPVLITDLFHTLALAAGVASAATASPDGTDLSPLLKNPAAKLGREALFFHYPHYYSTTTPVGAMRAGDWKLLEYFEDNRTELYNLKDDLGEKTDLAKQMPEKAAALCQQLHAWRESVGAAMPSPNPAFKPKTRNPAEQ